ncbi:MAG: hypothetical protein H7Y33_20320 [Cytophagales bacterium]|nr:hypothetical protein [Rhizobacter sp.]
MIRNMPQLRDQIVFLEVVDARHVGMNAKKYLAAARSVRTIIERELGGLAMHAFAIPELPTLQTTAENIYFDSHRRFADLDGSGNAVSALQLADTVIARARSRKI